MLSSLTTNQPIDSTPPSIPYTMQDIRCMALNIYYEARGESVKGQIAVGQVTMNRLNDPAFPKDVCEVVYQPKQFSWVRQFPKHLHTVVTPEILQIAIDTLSNKYEDVTNGALYYHNMTVRAYKKHETARIGAHIFYE